MSGFDTAVDLNLRTVLVTTEAAISEQRRWTEARLPNEIAYG
jgi:hypothetical protein